MSSKSRNIPKTKSGISSEIAQLPAKFQQALALHRSGRLANAQSIYEQILEIQPAHFEALHLLGVIAAQTNDSRKAVELLDRAIEINPNSAAAHNNKGSALKSLGRFDESLVSYNRALAINAEYAEAYSNRGIVLKELRRFDESLASYNQAISIKADYAEAYSNRGNVLKEIKQLDAALASFNRAIAIKADYAEAYSNRGTVLEELKQLDSALASYNQAIAIKPNYAEAYFNRGHVLAKLKRLDTALTSYDRAIAIKADYAEAYMSRGNLLKDLGQLAAALASYDRAIAIEADFAEAYCNRGNVLKELEHLDAALASYDRAIAIQSDCAEAYLNRGVVLSQLKQWDASLDSYDKAIAIKSDYAEAYLNRGVLLGQLKQWDASLDSYDRAIAINAEYAEAHRNKSFTVLLLGDFKNGWINYEWRWGSTLGPGIAEEKKSRPPLWLGKEPIAGKSILLQSEQGFGDTLQFCRYAKLVSALNARVILQVPESLTSLLANLEGVSELVKSGDPTPDVDFRCPLLSLPLAFNTKLETVPSSPSYLRSNPIRVAHWRTKLGEKTKPYVGLVWSGNAAHVNDRNRSIPLADLVPLLPADMQYVCLQKDVREFDKRTLERSPNILDFAGDLADFSETAALCECMDVVISVDTSVAHLSAALGMKTWILVPFSPDWRWLLDRDDSPWYPTVKLHRQERIGDWSGVFERIKTDLSQMSRLFRAP